MLDTKRREKDDDEDAYVMLAAVAFVLAGIALLVEPMPAAAQTVAGFVPTRFTVVDAGTVGKPDVILIPGLASSRRCGMPKRSCWRRITGLHLVQVNGFAGAPAGPNATGPMLPGVVEELHQYIVAGKMHPVVMGHSLGGLMTLMLADAHPEDVAKMVIVDSLPFYGDGVRSECDGGVDGAAGEGDLTTRCWRCPADQFAAMQPMMVKSMVKDEAGAQAGGGEFDRERPHGVCECDAGGPADGHSRRMWRRSRRRRCCCIRRTRRRMVTGTGEDRRAVPGRICGRCRM